MRDTLRASNHGLAIANTKRKNKGWSRKDNPSPYSTNNCYTSQGTLKRFWSKKAIDRKTFISICNALEIPWKDVAEARKNIYGTPDISFFVGRRKEIEYLKTSLSEQRFRLISILGVGGIGKTFLATQLVYEVADDYEFVFWLSLREAPSANYVLSSIIKFVSENKKVEFSENTKDQIKILINEFFSKFRCLVVLDNVESILEPKTISGKFCQGYEDYEDLICKVAEYPHQSSLILTSREKPSTIINLENSFPILNFELGQLIQDAEKILEAKLLAGSPQEYECIIKLCNGNPQILQILSSRIATHFNRSITDFLKDEEQLFIFGNIRDILNEQFSRLSAQEKGVMYWLAINREPISGKKLAKLILNYINKSDLYDVLDSLNRRSLLEKNSEFSAYTLQNVIMEFITEKFLNKISQELSEVQLNVFHTHSLIFAQVEPYIREVQNRLILKPIRETLLAEFGNSNKLYSHLKSILKQIHKHSLDREYSYAAGNFMNLLCDLNYDLSVFNFKNLTVREAYLKNITLQGLDFRNIDFQNCVFSDTFDSVLCIALSPNGSLLAAGDTNGTIYLWTIETSTLITMHQAHSGWIRTIVFSDDGNKLASASTDFTIKLWDISNPNQLEYLQTMEGHTGWIWSLAFSPDGTQIVSGSDDTSIRIWNIYNGQCINTLTEHKSWVRFIAFAKNTSRLITASSDQVVKIWNHSSGQCLQTWQEKTHEVRAVALSPDGKYIATGSEASDCKVRLLDLYNDGAIIKIFEGHNNRIWSVVFSPCGKFLATGSADKKIKLWDIEKGECINTFVEKVGRIRSLAFSNNGTKLVSGTDSQGIKVWDITTGRCLSSLEANSYRMWSVAFIPGQIRLVSAGDDAVLRIYDIQTRQVKLFLSGHKGCIRSVKTSTNGRFIASSSNDCTVKIWDTITGKCLHTLQGHKDWVWDILFTPDGRKVISISDDQTIKMWSTKNGRCLENLKLTKTWSWAIALNFSGDILAIADEDRKIYLWDLNTKECIRILEGHSDKSQCLAFSPDSEVVISGSHDNTIKIWDVTSSQCIKTLKGHTDQIRSVAFDPRGKYIASAGDDQIIKIWSIQTGKILYDIDAHEKLIWSVKFNIDGSLLASASEDQKVKLWRMSDGNCLKVFRANRIYEGLNLEGVKGLTSAQCEVLLKLGANIN